MTEAQTILYSHGRCLSYETFLAETPSPDERRALAEDVHRVGAVLSLICPKPRTTVVFHAGA